jgi:universal stress protein A
LRIDRILFATDFSDASDEALLAAAHMATSARASVTVLHVAELPAATTHAGFDLLASAEVSIRVSLEKVALRLREHGVEIVEVRADHGIAAPVICDVAHEGRFDLVVVGTHSRKGLSRMLMGSVAEHVVRHAPCPVLTFRPRASWDYRAPAANG